MTQLIADGLDKGDMSAKSINRFNTSNAFRFRWMPIVKISWPPMRITTSCRDCYGAVLSLPSYICVLCRPVPSLHTFLNHFYTGYYLFVPFFISKHTIYSNIYI